MLGIWYLSTRSEAWLDLDTSQLWCFSCAFANFSAAAIGHPERLQGQKADLIVSTSSSLAHVAPSPPLPWSAPEDPKQLPTPAVGFPEGMARRGRNNHGCRVHNVLRSPVDDAEDSPCIKHTQPSPATVSRILGHSRGHEQVETVDTDSTRGYFCR